MGDGRGGQDALQDAWRRRRRGGRGGWKGGARCGGGEVDGLGAPMRALVTPWGRVVALTIPYERLPDSKEGVRPPTPIPTPAASPPHPLLSIPTPHLKPLHSTPQAPLPHPPAPCRKAASSSGLGVSLGCRPGSLTGKRSPGRVSG